MTIRADIALLLACALVGCNESADSQGTSTSSGLGAGGSPSSASGSGVGSSGETGGGGNAESSGPSSAAGTTAGEGGATGSIASVGSGDTASVGSGGSTSQSGSGGGPPLETGWPNEPAGLENFLDCPFDDVTCGGRLWDVYGGGAHDSLRDAPMSPSGVYVDRLLPNATNGGTNLVWPGVEHPDDARPLREIYVGLWWKMNAAFQGLNNNSNKLFYVRTWNATFGAPETSGIFILGGPQDGPCRLYWGGNGLEDNSHACAGKGMRCEPNKGRLDLVTDNWYRVETYCKASTCKGCKDGILRWWITPQGADPVLVGEYTDINLGANVINEFMFDHTWDGSGSLQCDARDCSREWDHYIDHIRISGAE